MELRYKAGELGREPIMEYLKSRVWEIKFSPKTLGSFAKARKTRGREMLLESFAVISQDRVVAWSTR